jgi:hypothetical protein
VAHLRRPAPDLSEPPEWLERYVPSDWWNPDADPLPPNSVLDEPAAGTLPVNSRAERVGTYHAIKAFRRWRDACDDWHRQHPDHNLVRN